MVFGVELNEVSERDDELGALALSVQILSQIFVDAERQLLKMKDAKARIPSGKPIDLKYARKTFELTWQYESNHLTIFMTSFI